MTGQFADASETQLNATDIASAGPTSEIVPARCAQGEANMAVTVCSFGHRGDQCGDMPRERPAAEQCRYPD